MSESLSETRATLVSAVVEDMLRLSRRLLPPLPNPTDDREVQLTTWTDDLATALRMIYDRAEEMVDDNLRLSPPVPPGRSS